MKTPTRNVEAFVTKGIETPQKPSESKHLSTESIVAKRRVTLDLPADLYKKLRYDAVEQDTTMVDIITELLRRHYNSAS